VTTLAQEMVESFEQSGIHVSKHPSRQILKEPAGVCRRPAVGSAGRNARPFIFGCRAIAALRAP
jgi:hypothetical protein